MHQDLGYWNAGLGVSLGCTGKTDVMLESVRWCLHS